MRFKLDENLGSRTAATIVEFGHEVETVSQEKLNGISDADLFEACISERRCIVTLDLDFADILRFPPNRSAGIAVLRPHRQASPRILSALVRNMLTALQSESIDGRLWVVHESRVRVHDGSHESDG